MAGIKKLPKILLLLLIAVFLIGGGVVLHKKRSAKLAHVPQEMITPWALHTAPVTTDPVDSGFPALAMVSTREEVTIMARISGRILAMGPREGVPVKQGELLVKIDSREISDKIHALKAQRIAAQAETSRNRDELLREEKLFKDGGSSRSAVEARRTASVAAGQKVKSLDHEISSLEVQKGYGSITSPTDGIISVRLAEPGDMAVPGRPLYKITSSSGALVKVELPQSILHEIRPGTPMVLYHNGQQTTLPVNRVFPTVDARALGFVEADLSTIPFDLPSGSRVACRIILKQVRNAVRVPYGSLLCGGDKTQCRVARVIRQNKTSIIRMVEVSVRLRGHEGIAVTGNIKSGDRLVVAHESVLLQLKDGDPVIVAGGKMP